RRIVRLEESAPRMRRRVFTPCSPAVKLWKKRALPLERILMASVVDVTEIMDAQKTGLFHVRIVVMCALMLFLDGIDNLGIAYVAPALTQSWHLSRGALAPVFNAGILGVAIGALVTGPLTDRFGRRPMMLGTVIWFSLLTIAVTQASNLTELIVLRFFACLGLGSLVPMAVVVSSENAPRRTRAT